MRKGLNSDQQIEIADKMVNEQFEAALNYIKNPPKRGDAKFKTPDDFDRAVSEGESNPFYAKVKREYDFLLEQGRGAVNEDELNKRLSVLKIQSKEALKTGKEPAGIMDVVGNAFQNFDFMNPIGSIGGIISSIVKGVAMLIGGDMAAPWLKSMKASWFEKRSVTTAQADQELRFQNAAEGLAASMGMDPAKSQSFVQKVTEQLIAKANKPVSNAPSGGATSGDKPSAALTLEQAAGLVAAANGMQNPFVSGILKAVAASAVSVKVTPTAPPHATTSIPPASSASR